MGTYSHPLGRLWWQNGVQPPPTWEALVVEWAPAATHLGGFGGRMGTYSHPFGSLSWQNGHPTHLGFFGGRMGTPPTWESLVAEWAPTATHLGGFGGRMGTDSICSPIQNHSPTQNQSRPRPSQDKGKPSQSQPKPWPSQTKPNPQPIFNLFITDSKCKKQKPPAKSRSEKLRKRQEMMVSDIRNKNFLSR